MRLRQLPKILDTSRQKESSSPQGINRHKTPNPQGKPKTMASAAKNIKESGKNIIKNAGRIASLVPPSKPQ